MKQNGSAGGLLDGVAWKADGPGQGNGKYGGAR